MLLFSHGIGGTRNSYSGICCEISSAVRTDCAHTATDLKHAYAQ